MRTCKTAFLVIWSHKAGIFLGYMFACSLLMIMLSVGVVVTSDDGNGRSDAFQQVTVGVAVIDRDSDSQHAFKQGIERALADNATFHEVSDTTRDMQDALAADQIKLLVIIPQDYTERFVQAAREGSAMPSVDTVTGSSSGTTAMAGIQVNGFLDAVRLALASDMDVTIDEAIDLVVEQQADLPQVTVRTAGDGSTSGRSTAVSITAFIVVAGSMVYPMMMVMTLAVGLVVSRFNEPLVRSRLAAPPQSSASIGGGVMVASLVVAAVVWAYHAALLLVIGAVMPGGLGALDPSRIALSLAAMLALCLTALAFGFMVGQFSLSWNATSGVANVVSMVAAFLSGAWVPSSMMPDIVIALAKFTPGWWYVESIYQSFGGRDAAIAGAPDFSGWCASVGVLLLFALAFASIGLTVGRVRQLNPTAAGPALTQVV
ncbi:ABC-2 family transporter protein [Bifidobacterium lemurum]|uniref:ABC-2 family transporter protein n=1 Tax=Bifidobacterium lemurum TaxID=1603886 RepID=A0A261FMM1_9BIFI|nr:ABC transporter permease [Bifidobacterium lemurum]OZG60235.1 ABC-2 family transporter protein [Bifidobacterium lemurum]QOL34131.1 ABC transporter permease [Bifidobacterium lemurum]